MWTTNVNVFNAFNAIFNCLNLIWHPYIILISWLVLYISYRFLHDYINILVYWLGLYICYHLVRHNIILICSWLGRLNILTGSTMLSLIWRAKCGSCSKSSSAAMRSTSFVWSMRYCIRAFFLVVLYFKVGSRVEDYELVIRVCEEALSIRLILRK